MSRVWDGVTSVVFAHPTDEDAHRQGGYLEATTVIPLFIVIINHLRRQGRTQEFRSGGGGGVKPQVTKAAKGGVGLGGVLGGCRINS